MANHGPSNVLFPIVERSDQKRYRFSVWSLYPAPADRDLSATIQSTGSEYLDFKMARSFLDARILFPLVKALRLKKPEILHCHLLRANIYGRIAARIAGVPMVISTHHGVEDYMVGNKLRDSAARCLEKLTDSTAVIHVGVSDSVCKHIQKSMNISIEKVVRIYNGIEYNKYDQYRRECNNVRKELGLSLSAIVIGSVGGLIHRKNYSALINVARIMLQQNNMLQFVIVGEGNERRNLENMIAASGLSRSIILTGFRTDIPRVIQAFDIFAMTTRAEGFGLALVEAMATGLPCVVYDIGPLNEIINKRQGGICVKLDDIDSFCCALDSLVVDPGKRSAIGNNARARVETLFSVDIMVHNYNKLYDRLYNKYVVNTSIPQD